jgi:hypothetical protein
MNLVDGRFLNTATMAEAANERANLYSLLMRVVCDPPYQKILTEIRGGGFTELNHQPAHVMTHLKPGIDIIRDYTTKVFGLRDAEILSELSQDRTSILGILNNLALKSPVAGLVAQNQSRDSVVKITYFPLEDDEIHNKKVGDVLDYLCIQLDYMSVLCRREQNQWLAGQNAIKTISQESDFLRTYLASGVVKWCCEAQDHAKTDYYRGFLNILNSFIPADLNYLNGLILSVK